MSKLKFASHLTLGIVIGLFLHILLKRLGVYSLDNVWHILLGEPNAIKITLVAFVSILVIYFMITMITRLYRKHVKS